MRRVVVALLACLSLKAAEWDVSYFYDRADETLHFTALAFPSAQRGIAAGVITDDTGAKRPRNVMLLTADGGNTWTESKLDDLPLSLFFLDDSQGWMVTESGIWKTEESGRTWKRISKHSRGTIQRVWFLDANHGFAAGARKTVLETKNGGKDWDAVKAAKEPTGNPDFAAYTHIAFVNNRVGLIAGSAIPPRSRNLSSRQVPTMTIQLQTSDGGVTWKPSSAPLLGNIAGIQLRGARGLLLFNFANEFELLSEVYRLDTRDGSTKSVYKGKDLKVTDMLLFNDKAYLVAVQPPGQAKRATELPGKVHVLESSDLESWTEMPVDYRASATEPVLAGPDPEHAFLATDNGMILRLKP